MKVTLSALFVLLLVGVLNPQPETPQATAAAPVEAQDRHAPPERPRATVDLPPDAATSGRAIHVKAGDSLQHALESANPGDTIMLEPGATYTGPFRLPRKSGGGWITITTAAVAQLPPRGRRIAPAQAPLMPRLVSSADNVIEAMPGAHHYRLVGLHISPSDGVYVNTLVQLGDRETSVDEQPHHIVIERAYLHGDAKKGSRRGVALNSRDTAVVDSYLADFKEVGADSQAISGWNGAGPFRIENNYLEAAGENVMFGGADPSMKDLVPADIHVRRNHMAKPLRWKKDAPGYEGTEWAVKNLFELKNARRVLVEGNVFEYNWPHAQNGFAILFTVRNQDGGAPWSVVEDVTFANNIVRHVAGGINVLGKDDNQPSQQTRRIAIRNNLFYDVGGRWGNGRLFQLLDGTHSISIDHNTALQTGSVLFGGDHAPHTGFVFQNNVLPHNEHGITGSGTEPGTQSLARYFPRSVVRGNVFVGGNAGQYPQGNTFASSMEDAGLAGLRSGQLKAAAAQPVRGRGRGAVAGADLVALVDAVAGVAPLDSTSVADNAPIPRADLKTGANDTSARSVGEADAGSTTDIAAGVQPRPAIALALFWGALGLLFYVYIGYPLVAAVRGRLRERPVRRAPLEPRVSIIVVAHNEEERIDARLRNLLALDYPREKVEILVGSDGSTDGTVGRAMRYSRFGVRVVPFAIRRGKAAVVNDLVAMAGSDFVLFADARQQFDRGALRALLQNFSDPQVGAVSGELMLRPAAGAAAAGHGACFYWRYEKFIRLSESRADSTVGATGAIYAMRRELFQAIPADTLLDDVLIPLQVVNRGYRVVFEPAAHAFDGASVTARQEFARKARTIAGTFQLLARERWLFNPMRNRLWLATMSHKALRLTLPLLHLTLLGANVALADVWPYSWLLAGQMAFYAAAACGALQRQAQHRFVGFTIAYTLCLLCWATIVGFYRFVGGRQPVTWERTVPATTVARNERGVAA